MSQSNQKIKNFFRKLCRTGNSQELRTKNTNEIKFKGKLLITLKSKLNFVFGFSHHLIYYVVNLTNYLLLFIGKMKLIFQSTIGKKVSCLFRFHNCNLCARKKDTAILYCINPILTHLRNKICIICIFLRIER